MIVVLGVYIAAAYAFVSRNASETLNQQLRNDFTWVYASLYQDESTACSCLTEPERSSRTCPLPWVQVWRGDRSRDRLPERRSDARSAS